MLSVPGGEREHGFTLIELVVAMAAGIGVILALTTLIISVLHDTRQTYSRIDATRQTRLALSGIENELDSACVGTGTNQSLAPIQAGSDAETLDFLSYTGTVVNPTPLWHELHFAAGALTDTTYAVTGSAGAWARGALQATRTVLDNVTTQPGIPFFQYFAYAPTGGAGGEDYWAIPNGHDVLPSGVTPPASPLGVPLSAGASGTAASTVEVLITLVGGPSNPASGATTPGATDPETDAISLRLTSPPDEAPASAGTSYGPCR
jgi:hypothetical protein